MSLPCDQLGDDEVAWGLEANGGFSVKSAYMLIKELDRSSEENVWKKVWTWEGPAHLIGWRPAEEDWFSLNSDGSLTRNLDKSAAGGVIRDANGRFVVAFAANLGVCSIMRAELRGIIEGIRLAWSMGIRKLRIQTDSKAAVEMLSKFNTQNNQHASLIEQFRILSSYDWQLSIHHIYREANFAADYLANLGHSLSYGIHVMAVPYVSLQYWLNFDLVGSCTSRLIPNKM
ncbi:Putative ribonuclease H protein At1g65750 [Linum perenne]